MKHILALIFVFLSFACLAGVYVETDSQGNVVYSDIPSNRSKPVELPRSENSISTPPATEKTPQTTTPASSENNAASDLSTHQNYTAFQITSPANQETFQNQRDVPVTLKIDPPLQSGDRVQLYVDGIPSGEPSSDVSQLVVRQVERGEHQLNAAILDADDHVLSKTDNVTVFIHYSAIPTGSGAVSPVSQGGNGVTPSTPGSGVTTPAAAGAGIMPPSSNGSGITPPSSAPLPPGTGVVPPASYGGGAVPGRP